MSISNRSARAHYLRHGEVLLVEEMYPEFLEERSGHIRKKCLQVITDTPERKPLEVRECDTSWGWRMQQLPLDFMIRNRGAKPNLECLQITQE